MTSRIESKTHYKEKDKINMKFGEKIKSAVGDVAILNHISYYNQGGVRTSGQVETINPNNGASQVKEGKVGKTGVENANQRTPYSHHRWS